MNTATESSQLLLQDITNTYQIDKDKNKIQNIKEKQKTIPNQGRQNSFQLTDQKTKQQKKKIIDFSKALSISHSQFNFAAVQPGYIVQQNFILKLQQNLPKPTSIFMYVHCQDQKVNSLDEYVFGIRKNCQYQYFDQFKFKASKKGQYSFILGAKAPNFQQNTVLNCKMFVWIDGQSQHCMQIPLSLKIKIPRIITDKSLSKNQDDLNNLIKLSLSKSKAKKEFKIPFKLLDSIGQEIKLDVQLIGIDNINGAECKQKSIFLKDKGMFLVIIIVQFTTDIIRRMKNDKSYILRKVLILRNKANRLIYHFPVQITFTQSSKTNESAQ